MYKVMIWGLGYTYNQYINAIKYQEFLGNLRIIGVTGREEIYEFLDGVPFIPAKDIDTQRVDYLIITSDIYYLEISNYAKRIGFSEEKLIRGGIFLYPGLDFEKYILLLQKRVSIISNNCWAGVTYHTLRMKFLSPFINMFENDEDYLRLLGNIRYYLNCKLVFDRYEYTPILKRNYPVCKLDDVLLHFNHYKNMEEVEEKWSDRCKRINWDNLFIMMFTEKEHSAECFDKLPLSKKICFVPFECSYKSAYTLQIARHPQMQNIPFWQIVSGISQLAYNDYDLIELLLNGKIENCRTSNKLVKRR